jgi:crossover junction endodeoxyribonuclease RuvC
VTLTFAVDPGATGAIACLRGVDLLWVEDMPYADGEVLAPVLASLFLRGDHVGPRRAIVERAQSMPGQGISGAFRYGTGYGVIKGVLGALDIPFEVVAPARWKKAAGLIGADKSASRRRAIELWPAHASLFARAKDDGRAEAALIARYAPALLSV